MRRPSLFSFLLLVSLLLVSPALALEFPLSCTGDPKAAEFAIEVSEDLGKTWREVKKNTSCAFTLLIPGDAPENVLLLIRYIARNSAQTAKRYEAGHFIHTGWLPPAPPNQLGVR